MGLLWVVSSAKCCIIMCISGNSNKMSKNGLLVLVASFTLSLLERVVEQPKMYTLNQYIWALFFFFLFLKKKINHVIELKMKKKSIHTGYEYSSQLLTISMGYCIHHIYYFYADCVLKCLKKNMWIFKNFIK